MVVMVGCYSCYGILKLTCKMTAGHYCGQEGVRTGGMRYHEGVVTRTEPCSGNRVSSDLNISSMSRMDHRNTFFFSS